MKTVYADNNATTPGAPEVMEVMTPYFTGGFYNPSAISGRVCGIDTAIARARRAVAAFLRVSDTTKIITEDFRMSPSFQVETVRYRQIATREDCYNALPNDIAAVYAWFQDLTLSEEILASEDKFVSTIMELLEKPLSVKRKAHVGPFYEVGITAKAKELTETKESALRQYAQSENTRNDIGRALKAATLLQAPLYVGKADRLANRIWDHVSHQTGFCKRIEKAGSSLQDCLLAYVPIPNPDEAQDELISLVQLVEDIITKLSRPGFVLRSG